MNTARSMVAGVLLVAMLLVACTGDDDGNDTEPTSTPEEAIVAVETPDNAEDEAPEAEATEEPATATVEPTEAVETPTVEAAEASPTEAEPTATEERGAATVVTTVEATEGTGEPTPVATFDIDPEAEAALFEMALAEEDLPEGWVQVSIMPVTEADEGLTFCNAEPYSNPEARLAAVEAEFEIDPEIGPFLLQNLTAYLEAEATEAMEHAQDVVAGCEEWTDEDGVVYELSELDLPDYGDDSFGLRVILSVTDFQSIPADFAFVRVGGVLLAIGHIALEEADAATFEQIVETAVEKVEASDFRP